MAQRDIHLPIVLPTLVIGKRKRCPQAARSQAAVFQKVHFLAQLVAQKQAAQGDIAGYNAKSDQPQGAQNKVLAQLERQLLPR